MLRHTAQALDCIASVQRLPTGLTDIRASCLLLRGYAFYHLGGDSLIEAWKCAKEIETLSPGHRCDALLLKASTLYANDPTAALGVLHQCLDPTIGADQETLEDVRMVRSQCYLFLGYYQQAIDESLECVRTVRRLPRKAVYKTVLGRIFLYTNDFRRAITELSEANVLFESLEIYGPSYLECGSYLAAAYLIAGDPLKAISVAQRVRERLAGTDLHYAEGWANLELHFVEACLQAISKEPSRRREFLDQSRLALRRAEKHCRGYRVGLAYVRYFEGIAAERIGDSDKAFKSLQGARRLCSRYGLLFLRWRCLHAMARLVEDSRQALQWLRSAANDIRLLRDNLTSPLLTPLFFDDKCQVFESLVHRLLLNRPNSKRRWTNEAVEHIESCKARNIVTSLASSSQWPLIRASVSSRSPELLASETATISAFRSLSVTASGSRSMENREPLALLEAAKQAHKEQVESLLRSHDVGQHFTQPVEYPPEELLHSILDRKTAVLEYFLADDKLYCFPCTLEGGIAEPIVQTVNRHVLYNLIRRCLPNAPVRPSVRLDVARDLYRLVCHGLEEVFDGFRRLVVIPHAELRQVPFGVLHDGEKFLIDRVDGIVHVPSLTVLWLCRQQPRPTAAAPLILCNPPSGPPWSLMEGELVCQRLKQQGIEPRMVSGDNASVHEFTSVQSASVIHVATHGKFSSEDPLSSALLLASDGGVPAAFQMYKLFGLKWQTELVACAACESGKSFIPRGDGVVGLRYGLFASGARSIIDAQWAMDDLATAMLMDAFYEAWTSGKDKAEALCDAQRYLLYSLNGQRLAEVIEEWLERHPELLEQPWVAVVRSVDWFGNSRIKPFQDPSFWAAFTLQGDWV